MKARLKLAAEQGRTISQSEVGRELGVTGVTVGRWEADKKEPSLDIIERLGTLLGVDPGWLAFGSAAEGRAEDDVSELVLAESASFDQRSIAGAASLVFHAADAYEQKLPMAELRLLAVRALFAVGAVVAEWFRMIGQYPAGVRLAADIERAFLERIAAAKKPPILADVVDDIDDMLFEIARTYEDGPVPGLGHSLTEIYAALVRDERRAAEGKRADQNLLPRPRRTHKINRAIQAQIESLRTRRGSTLEEIADRLETLAAQGYELLANSIKDEGARSAMLEEKDRWSARLGGELSRIERETNGWRLPVSKAREEMVRHAIERLEVKAEEIARIEEYVEPDGTPPDATPLEHADVCRTPDALVRRRKHKPRKGPEEK